MGDTGSVASPPGILRGVDRAAFAVSLSARLRSVGVAVDLTATADLIRALHAGTPNTRSELYWACRIALVRRHADIGGFDAVFEAVFGDAVLRLDPNARRRPLPSARRDDDTYHGMSGPDDGDGEPDAGLPWATLPSLSPGADGDDPGEQATPLPLRLPSELAGLADTPFGELRPAELALLGDWLARAATNWPRRRTRRMAVDPSGHRVALRPTVSRARRTGFEPVTLVTTAPRWRPRRVVMLCDVSASMQAEATAYLHLMRALVLGAHAEAFAFATRLTRLTPALTHRSPAEAVAAATDAVSDRFGGTRIAAALTSLLTGRHGGLLRGAVVLIGSDGWDSEPAERLERAMSRLRRRAHQVLWINPRASASGFRPQVSTMAAALPFCDEFLPGGTVTDLRRVIAAIGEAGVPDRPRRLAPPAPLSSTG
jgi:uncharacterized protein with von Willebrand factor type A (vWA) domain